MQLLRDNLTLWTSSDSGEAEGAAAGQTESSEKKEEEEPKPAEEPKAEEQPAAAS